MVWSAVVIQSTLSDLDRKPTSLSLVAFERSIETDLDSTRTRSKLWVRIQTQNGRTNQVTSNTERFKGTITPLDQRHCQRKVLFVKPRDAEPPKVDTAW